MGPLLLIEILKLQYIITFNGLEYDRYINVLINVQYYARTMALFGNYTTATTNNIIVQPKK